MMHYEQICKFGRKRAQHMCNKVFIFKKSEEPLKLLFFYKEQFPKTKFEKKKQITPTWAKYLFNLSKVL